MGDVLTLDLEHKAATLRAFLAAAVREYGRVVYANSLGAEAMVLTDIIATHLPEIDIFSIDTGRLPEETHELLARLETRYGAHAFGSCTPMQTTCRRSSARRA